MERKRRAEEQKQSFKFGFIQKKINLFMRKLPENEKRKYESEEEKRKRKRLKEIKEILWKKSRKEGEKIFQGEEENTSKTPDIEKLETDLKNIE